METSHYDLLGLTSTASATDIKNAYRRAAMRWHPDKNAANSCEAAEMFKSIAEVRTLGVQQGVLLT